jgi:hypothetical protein
MSEIRGHHYDVVKQDDVVATPDLYLSQAALKLLISHYLTSPTAWFTVGHKAGWVHDWDRCEPDYGWWCPVCGDLLVDTNRKARRRHERKCGIKLDHVQLS